MGPYNIDINGTNIGQPPSQSLVVPVFTQFSQLQQHKSSNTNLSELIHLTNSYTPYHTTNNVLAIVIDTSNPRTINGMYGTSNVQDLVLITPEKIPILLSCLHDIRGYAHHPSCT